MLRILIVDDEKNAREALSGMIEQYNQNWQLVDACERVSDAVKAIGDHEPDVVLLDIKMGRESGFDLFKYFPRPKFKVIFITAYQQYALQAFRFAALDYLLKPVSPSHLTEALNKASDASDLGKLSLKIGSFLHNMSADAAGSKKVVLRTSDNIHLVELNDIMYCEAVRNYTNFYLSDDSRIMVSKTIGGYEDLFSDAGFFRIHMSYLLNFRYLKRYEKGDGGKVILKNGKSLPLATRKKDQFLARLISL